MRTETDQLFIDIFTTALEGGIGYWSQCSRYHWSFPSAGEDYYGFYADIQDVEDDPVEIDGEDEYRQYRIDRDVIVKGYNHAITSHMDKVAWSSGERPPYVVTQESREDWDFDAGDADAIVQLGLFGEVRYG